VGATRRSRHRGQWRARVEARCVTACGDPGNGDELEVPMQIREGPSRRPTPSPAGALQSPGAGDLRWRGVDPPAPRICGGGAEIQELALRRRRGSAVEEGGGGEGQQP
jgi:hypothetical protein